MSKERTLSRLEEAWQAFLKSFEGSSDSALFQAGVCGQWSIRDLMAHVTTWEEETLKALPIIIEGKSPPKYVTYGGIDAFNALQYEKKRNLSLDKVRKELTSTHKRLAAFLSGLPETAFTPRLVRRLSIDTYKHYREHTEQIGEWRKRERKVTMVKTRKQLGLRPFTQKRKGG